MGSKCCAPTWCCPGCDWCLNELTFCANGGLKTEPPQTRGYENEQGRRRFNYFRGQKKKDKCLLCDCSGGCGMWFFENVMSMIYKIDGKPPLVLPDLTDEEKAKKAGIISSLEELKDKAESGDIIVSGNDRSYFALEIEGLTESNLAHVVVVVQEEDQEKMIYQATISDYLNGCGGRTFDYAMRRAGDTDSWFLLLKLKPEYREIFNKNIDSVMMFLHKACDLDTCQGPSNRRYDLANNARIRLAIKSIMRGEDAERAKRYIQNNNFAYGNCSEFVAGVYQAAGLIDKETNCSFVTPESCCWIDVFEEYYQILFGIMSDSPYGRYLYNFSCVKPEDYAEVINSFSMKPPQ